jgi:hypothetical protein
VKTASGATAVQIVEKRRGVRRFVAHVGSAHDEAELAMLMAPARDRIHAGQQALDLPSVETGAPGGAVVTGSGSEVLWDVLTDAYRRLGFEVVADEAFRALVLARIVEPTSKMAAVGVLEELGGPAPHRLAHEPPKPSLRKNSRVLPEIRAMVDWKCGANRPHDADYRQHDTNNLQECCRDPEYPDRTQQDANPFPAHDDRYNSETEQ